ncbi:hypothetical protein [Pseudonocardia adelaidensis]|uniref:Uncharacterized protein n=1 Tax=Pseudonocardia adelaidensis TaxID=648754 RepID=A0ABP9NA11_9PSEU
MGPVRFPLAVGAGTAVAAAVGFDVLADEHPTHTASLGFVAAVVAVLRLRQAGRHENILAPVAGALVAQPVLHATTKLGGHHDVVDGNGLLHVVTADGPGTAMQIAVSALVVVAVASSARFTELLAGVLSRPVRLLVVGPPVARSVRAVAVRGERRGSMLRWCGWTLRAARRGPPVPAW